jgi:ATP-binding cassette, subfamily B, bacterial
MIFKKKIKFPFYKQSDQYECGAACLKMISKFYGRNFSLEHLRDICKITPDGISIKSLMNGAETLGFKTVPASINYQVLQEEAPLPCIAYWRDRHFLVVYDIKGNNVHVADPAHGLIQYKKNEFIDGWLNNKKVDDDSTGVVLLFEPTAKFLDQDNTDASHGLKGILPYLRNYNKYIRQIFLGLIAASFVQLILPFTTQKIIDKGVNLGNIGFIYVMLIAQLVLFLSQSFLTVVRSWLLLYIGSRVSMMLSSDYLIKLLSKSVSFFDSKTPGDFLQRINESSRIESFLTTVPDSIFSYLNSLIFLLVLALYSIKIFLIFLVGIILYTLWIWFFMKKRSELDFKRFDASSGLNSKLIQLVNGIQEVKVNGSERKHIRAWEKVRIQYYKTSVSSLKLSQYQNVGGTIINEVKNIFITFTGALLVMKGEITLGSLLAIQYIIGQVNAPLLGLVGFFRSIQDAKLSMTRFNEIDYVTPEESILHDTNLIEAPKQAEDIRLVNFNFSYTGDMSNLVLKNININIPKGKTTAIVGNSGSGKTTLLKVILKLYLPTTGDIFIGNLNLKHVLTDSWTSICGSVMQDGYIFSDTLAQNISESASEDVLDIDKLLLSAKLANIEEMVNTLPSGFNSTIGSAGSSGRTLSGGQRQRVLIARAVYKNPHFLFFDEATSSLDANNERVIVENLKPFYKGKTVLIIAHRLSTVRDADQIIVLKNGEIAEIGNHDELIAQKGEYFTLIKNQLELGN